MKNTKKNPKHNKILSVLLALLILVFTAVPALAAEKKGPAFQNQISAGYTGTWNNNGYTFIVTDGKVTGAQPEVIDLAVKTLNKSGWDLHAAYNWCLKNMTYTRKNQDNTGKLGVEQHAITGFKTKTGNCWTYAACLYYMGKILGEDIHVVKGEVPYANGSYGPHAWNEVIRDGKTYVIDADYEMARKKNGKKPNNGYLFQYKTKGTWKYRNIKRVV